MRRGITHLIDGDRADGCVEYVSEHTEVLSKDFFRHNNTSLRGELHEDRGGGVQSSVFRFHGLVALRGPTNA